MDELTDAQIDAALERGRAARLGEPRALACRYDRAAGRVVVVLTNGCVFAFPSNLAQGLEGASDDQLAQVKILGAGSALHWKALDIDLSVPGLLAGLFGTRAYMARQGGQTTSAAKAAAARSNGEKGGRPRKAALRTFQTLNTGLVYSGSVPLIGVDHMKQPGLDGRHRDETPPKAGEIHKKRGDTLNKNLPKPIPQFSPNARLDTMRKETGKVSVAGVTRAAKNRSK